jgi:hypothetical protein|eukprot:SAG25_NODE_754_length_5543_cov_2.360764_3_plen_75_part_00
MCTQGGFREYQKLNPQIVEALPSVTRAVEDAVEHMEAAKAAKAASATVNQPVQPSPCRELERDHTVASRRRVVA